MLTKLIAFPLLFSSLTIAMGAIVKPTDLANQGALFFFNAGPNACGRKIPEGYAVASVPESVFKSFPGATDIPEDNPLCKKGVIISDGYHEALLAPIVDYATGVGDHDIGISVAGFTHFGKLEVGIIPYVGWTVGGFHTSLYED